MSGNTAIDKIQEFEKFGSILGLERMTRLMELLGNPEKDLKVIHVAGTNGKGSICRYIYSALQEEGYKCGLYTSPFLEVFNERIEFNREYISDDDLEICTNKVLDKVRLMTDAGEQSPTEFEVITAVAFLYFKEKEADLVVLEVGLGGTGDSTNIMDKPLVSVIGSISYDHTDRLGNTITEIAGEKAGIIKSGCPVITSAVDANALKVIRAKADQLSCEYIETKDIQFHVNESSLKGYDFNVTIGQEVFNNVEIGMLGEHQIQNAICALTVLKNLRDREKINLKNESLYQGLKKAKQIGRFEIISEAGKTPLIILDGAHNPDGALALRKATEVFLKDKKILMVTGMLEDKDTKSILEEFTKITDDFIATEPDNPRKMDFEKLKAKIEGIGGNVLLAADIEAAIKKASEAADFDVVLYAGSLYLIGSVRKIINGDR